MAKLREILRSGKVSVSKRGRVMLLAVGFLLLCIITYFTVFISRQTNYFTNRNFRQLASLGGQVEERIVILREAFQNAVISAVKIQNEPKVKTVDDATMQSAGYRPKASKSDWDVFQQSLNGFMVTKIDPIPSYKVTDDLEKDLKTLSIEMNVVRGEQTSWLEFTCKMQHFGADKNIEREIIFQARTNFNNLVEPLIGEMSIESLSGSEHEEGFDDILLAWVEEKGSSVIFHQGMPEVNVASLDNLQLAEASDKTAELKILGGSTSAADIRLAGVTYKLYLQPLKIPIPRSGSKEQDSQWVVAGLVQASHFRHETWAFSYTLLISLAFIMALVVLSWPFLKLLFIGPKDRLRIADVYFLGFSLLIGSAVLTFFLLYGYTYLKSEYVELDGRLKMFSKDITRHLHEEVTDASREIDQLSQNHRFKVAWDWVEIGSKEGASPESLFRRYLGRERTQILEQIEKEQPNPYPFFTTAFWTNRAGEQEIKWTINPLTTNFISVRDRGYFQEIINGNQMELGQERFYLEPINSRVTGEKTVVISKAFSSKGIAAIDTKLMSLMQTVVPPGFGYRVIDGRGEVLFQSEETQQLKENFFEECDNDPSLRSLVFGRISDFASVNYTGKSHRLYVSPLKGFPNWTLIVFRNKQPLRTLYLEILTLAGFLFLVYALILLTAFSIIYLVKLNVSERTKWIWPSDELLGIHCQSLVVNLLLCVISALVIRLTDGRWTVLLVSLIGFTGIFNLALRLKFKLHFRRLRRAVEVLQLDKFLDRNQAYIWNMVVLMLMISALPAAAFFKVAYNEEMTLFIKHGQINIAKGLAEREARIKRLYSTTTTAPPIENEEFAKEFIKKRLAKGLDLYDDFFFSTVSTTVDETPEQQMKQTTDGLLSRINLFIPLFNQTSVELGGLVRNEANDNSWQWEESPSGNLVLHVPKGTQALHINTPFQTFRLPLLVWAIGLSVVLALIYYLTRFAVRKVFLLDLDKQSYITKLDDYLLTVSQNHFIVLNSPLVQRRRFPQTDEVYYIDLETEAQEKEWGTRVDTVLEGGNLPQRIIIDHFEYQIDDRYINSQKLRLIEKLLEGNRTVVILSSSEPTAYCFDKNGKDGANGLEHQLAQSGDRWTEVISPFMRVYFVEDDVKNLKKELSSLPPAPLPAQEMSRSLHSKVKKSTQLVQEECAPRECLRNIGQAIIAQRGFEKLSPKQIFNQILEQAELYYQRIWNSCSEGEKLTLIHLAEDRLLSPKDPHARRLFRKGLIVCDPDLRLMNETFKKFVLSQNFTKALESIETLARNTSPWEMLKAPLSIISVGVLLFLFFTQKDFYNSTLTIITAFTTGIPIFFKFLSMFQSDGSAPKGHD